MQIRLEKPEDYQEVENLTREAFWNVHVPGCSEHYLVHIMRGREPFIPELDFVAEQDGKLIGNIMYTKGHVEDDAGNSQEVILFGPVSVLPEYQGKGVGGALIRHSAAEAKKLGYTSIFLYGDPEYYTRFGFRPASDFQITPPDGRPHPALQAWELVPDALVGTMGRFFEDPIYETIDDAKVEAFDKNFAPKEKAVTESQQRFKELSQG